VYASIQLFIKFNSHSHRVIAWGSASDFTACKGSATAKRLKNTELVSSHLLEHDAERLEHLALTLPDVDDVAWQIERQSVEQHNRRLQTFMQRHNQNLFTFYIPITSVLSGIRCRMQNRLP